MKQEEAFQVAMVIGRGTRKGRLYLLDTQIQGQANLATTPKLTWDQWHQCYGHIAISLLEWLNWEDMVDGLNIDQSLIPSKSSEACIQAKQSHRSFPS